MLKQIWPRNLLSFGPDTEPLSLNKLNVLIGPNAAGKSNLIEAITLLRATPADVRELVRQNGGVGEWIWKGSEKTPASVEVLLENPGNDQLLRHFFAFANDNQSFCVVDERIENEKPEPSKPDPYLYYTFNRGHPVINTKDEENVDGKKRSLERDSVEIDASILAQRRDPDQYPEIYHLISKYEKIRAYREWSFGRNTVFRRPQKADMRNDRLEEDFSNLGLVLNRLRKKPKAKAAILKGLQDLYEGVSDYDISVEGGAVQVFFTEGEFTIPATRLSDGTLRYLCLLAILCDPTPPPLICIEEPELGLHPDILPQLTDLLIDASTRTQLIVTTHSDILVDALSETPESVVVCEKHQGQTRMSRLNADDLSEWLKNYRLGELWTKGEIGGVRW